ncbi:zinc finger domain-containing protein [Candidatus Marsarchaeota archaeon]|jgi:predicted RNA-binding Zn-ribbon protein involved in translation (DUF1610 family)|nr:zinc finger domain-containing protein [Candidatus Marsarchaeota archaeon]
MRGSENKVDNMVLPGKRCVSCGRLTSEYTEFKCPKCGKGTIIRCDHCREITNSYKCDVCGFEGP